MANFEFDIKEDLSLFQLKQLIIFLIDYIQAKLPDPTIDDLIFKIPENIKNQFKQVK